MIIFIETVPKNLENNSDSKPLELSREMVFRIVLNLWLLLFFGTVSKDMLISWLTGQSDSLEKWPLDSSESLRVLFLGLSRYVSMNMTISWPIDFFFDCLEKYAHFQYPRGSGIFGLLGLSR